MSDRPRTEVVDLLLEQALASCALDLARRHRCAARLQAYEVTALERIQADVLARACGEAVAPVAAAQREARKILLRYVPLCGSSAASALDHIWAHLSEAERARLLDLRDRLRDPVRSWLNGHAQDRSGPLA